MKFEIRSKDYKTRESTAAGAGRTARETLQESRWLSERAARVQTTLFNAMGGVPACWASGVRDFQAR